jgi:ribonuclease HI
MVDLQSMVNIFTDGACSRNPGPGGWAALLLLRNTARYVSGYERHTTNNRMELFAAISALNTLTRHSEVKIHTDSRYLRDGIDSWVHEWKRNNWLTASKKPVLNQDLWTELLRLVAIHHVHWMWVRGHAQNRYNNFVDLLARRAISSKVGIDERTTVSELEDVLDGRQISR